MTAQRLEEVDAATVKAWLDRGEAVLIDVREIGEHAREHIAGARLVPLSTFDAANANFPNSGKIVLHCASGIRSAKAGEKLVASGKTGVAHLKGGLPAWKSAGFPTEFNAKAPLSLPRQMQIIAPI
ncbi:MAG: rhodanese-like domain-containing protein [Rhodospirillales bacterium]|nr:rhodanese-like domain-containing protein [Rhodospirillales bacterium]